MNHKKSHHNYKQPLEIHIPSNEKIKEIIEMQEKMERMYHYTSMDTFFKIIDGINDDFFTFRAGSVYTMNDRQEMKLGYECIKKYLPVIEKDLKVDKEDKLFHLLEKHETNKEIKDNFAEWLINDDISNFVVSFSSKPDILPMWALYGDRGKGVCLEFAPYIIKEYYKEKQIDSNLSIKRCVYNDEEIENLLLNELKIIYKSFLNSNSIEERRKPMIKIQHLGAMCGLVGAYVKHPGFEYEQEIRMNVFRNRKEWRMTETRFNHHTVYVEVPIPIKSLTKVIVGPAANMEDSINSITMSLRAKGIIVDTVHSDIPFRIY